MASDTDAQAANISNGPSVVAESAPATGPGSSPKPVEEPEKAPIPTVDDEPTQSTSEANIAATDPNTMTTLQTTADEKQASGENEIDMKASDVAEGAESGAAVVAPGSSEDIPSAPATTPKANNQKRRSTGAVPEHKSKKLNRKKSQPVLHLDAEPGQYYFARLKGHPPWPAIVCDEDMLPEQLLATRPVTAKRPDGSYREDFLEGGKNAKDRTYPVMFLATNEFAWLPNVDLASLDPDKVKEETQGKKSKRLFEAYQIAAEQHDLAYFKKILSEFEVERQKAEAEYAAKERELAEKEAKKAAEKAEKSAKKETKAKRKSKAGVDDEDVTMADADTPKSASKKRKKSTAGEDGDETKPAKTPKTSLKVNLSKATNGESGKAKSKVSKPKESPKEPELTEEERLEKRHKSVLFLRHKLQKGLLQDKAPDEAEMASMAKHFDELEKYKVLEVNIIRSTKIHKVLKAILKLDSLPMDDKYKFKERSRTLLQEWTKILDTNTSGAKEGDNNNDLSSYKEPNGEVTEEPKPEPTANEPEASDVSKTTEPVKEQSPVEHSEPNLETVSTPTKPVFAATETPVPATETQEEAKTELVIEQRPSDSADVPMTDAKQDPAPVADSAAAAAEKPVPVEAEGNVMAY